MDEEWQCGERRFSRGIYCDGGRKRQSLRLEYEKVRMEELEKAVAARNGNVSPGL